MEKIKIHNRDVLQYQLQLLEQREKELRAKIIDDAGTVVQIVTDPSTLIKSTIKNLVKDPEVRSDLLNLVLGWVGNYVQSLLNKPGPVTDFFKRIIEKFKWMGG